MKRIANDVALQTLLYVIGGLRKIRVIDVKNTWTHEFEVVYEGLYKDWSYLDRSYKIEHSAVHGLYAEDDVLVIELNTVSDTY